MAGEHVEDQVVGSSCPSCLGEDPGVLHDPLVQREDEEHPRDVLD